MNKRRKRSVGIIVAVCGLLFLTSCRKIENEDIPKLVWYLPGEGVEDLNMVMEKANEIIVPKIGAELEVRFISSSKYSDTMNMKVSMQENFDLCFTGYINPYRRIAVNGGLLRLDEYIESRPKLKNIVPEYAWDGAMVNGEIYAVPNMQFVAYCKAANVNVGLSEKYGLNESKIEHITDLEPFFEQVKNNEPDFEIYNPSWGYSCMFKKDKNGFPVSVLDDVYVTLNEKGEYKAYPTIEIKEVREGIYKLHEWYKKGYIREDIGITEQTELNEKHTAATVVMYKPGGDGENKAKGNNKRMIRIGEATLGNGAGTTAMTGIGAWSEHPEKALALIELVNTDKELFNILVFGIEGEHYKKTGQNSIELKKKEENGYFINAAWKFGNQFLAYTMKGQEDDVWEETKRLNDTAERIEFYGFKLNTQNIEDELTRISTIYDQYDYMNNGSRNPDEYLDEFSKKLHEVGVDKVCDEVERQLNEYLKLQNKLRKE